MRRNGDNDRSRDLAGPDCLCDLLSKDAAFADAGQNTRGPDGRLGFDAKGEFEWAVQLAGVIIGRCLEDPLAQILDNAARRLYVSRSLFLISRRSSRPDRRQLFPRAFNFFA